MPALRRCLRQPHGYLAAVALALVLAGADARRAPERQWTARGYVRLVEAYQRWLRPVSSLIVRCRYRPTCSEYSRQAVTRFGIAEGARLTVRRLWSCRGAVALGSPDPVPEVPAR
ncbi:MAG: membrane protein insertion efficiency factor YidD [Bryobacterales bacterium]|nr:membrane protein insertion efficiency factor YidD [Bryobacterales bacterium]